MKVTTNGRELGDAINGLTGGTDLGDIGDEHRPALAQAFNALARLVDTQTGQDITFLADVQADTATVSIAVVGKTSEAPARDVPWQNPHLAEIDRERQAGQAAADDAEAERIRELLERSA
jgi:hypothetical protein